MQMVIPAAECQQIASGHKVSRELLTDGNTPGGSQRCFVEFGASVPESSSKPIQGSEIGNLINPK
jgi:hypothetical protein